MNILPKKSWHVRNKDNVERVRKDEAQAAEEEREAQRRVERAEREARTEYLRKKARGALQQAEEKTDDNERSGASGVLEHLNLFPLEESSEKKGNEEYLKEKKDQKEKQERAIGLLVSLGPQPGTEVTPWYMKTGKEKEEKDEKEEKKKKERESEKGMRKPISEEEREKRDRRLKDSLDPLKNMKKALAIKDREKHKSKKKERRDGGDKRGSGESSIERLRAERLQRETEERRRAQALIDQRNGKGKDKEPGRVTEERDRPYNSAYFPELARKRQKKDRESWRDDILKS
ncbi:leukocyte receptor cluster member 1 [Polymixia lowei]